MSGFQVTASNVTTTSVILTASTVTTLITASLGSLTVTHVDVANITAGAITITIERYNGTTSWYLCHQTSVAAHATLQVSGTVLQANQLLRATSSDGSGNLHVHVHHTIGSKVGGGESGH